MVGHFSLSESPFVCLRFKRLIVIVFFLSPIVHFVFFSVCLELVEGHRPHLEEGGVRRRDRVEVQRGVLLERTDPIQGSEGNLFDIEVAAP